MNKIENLIKCCQKQSCNLKTGRRQMKFMNETARGWNTMRRMHLGITYGNIQMNGQKKCAGNHY